VDIFLGEQWSQTTLPLGNQFVSKGAVGARGTNAGALADIDDPIFSSAYGEDEGYWEPLKFFQETGANIFALEPYDPVAFQCCSFMCTRQPSGLEICFPAPRQEALSSLVLLLPDFSIAECRRISFSEENHRHA
jgi:hypothetical protein